MNIETMLLMVFVGILLGSMLFFAVTVAPTVFKSLAEDQAGRFLRAMFPRYYLWGLVITIITAAVALMSDVVLSVVLAVIAVLFLYARQVLMPKINQARDDDLMGVDGAGKLFSKLHLRSVLINAAQLLALIGIAIYMML